MAEAATTEKPAYLGLLNAISLAETAAGQYLSAWADVTPNEDLACTLRLVAARETSHGEVFCRRISELGFELRKKSDPRNSAQLAKYANPDISDLEKIGPPPERSRNAPEPFADITKAIARGEYDPMTANLLTWYINEEKDSGKRLAEAYDCVREMAGEKRRKPAGMRAEAPAPSADAEAMMACMTEGFSRLEKTLEKLAKAVR